MKEQLAKRNQPTEQLVRLYDTWAKGGHDVRVERTQDFAPALARASGLPAILHCLFDPEAITPTRTLSAIRAG